MELSYSCFCTGRMSAREEDPDYEHNLDPQQRRGILEMSRVQKPTTAGKSDDTF